MKTFFNCEGDWTLKEVVQRGLRILLYRSKYSLQNILPANWGGLNITSKIVGKERILFKTESIFGECKGKKKKKKT